MVPHLVTSPRQVVGVDEKVGDDGDEKEGEDHLFLLLR